MARKMATKPPVIFARSVGGLLGADFEPDFFSTRFSILELVRGFYLVRDFQDQISTQFLFKYALMRMSVLHLQEREKLM